jgi:hypothetical protein
MLAAITELLRPEATRSAMRRANARPLSAALDAVERRTGRHDERGRLRGGGAALAVTATTALAAHATTALLNFIASPHVLSRPDCGHSLAGTFRLRGMASRRHRGIPSQL